MKAVTEDAPIPTDFGYAKHPNLRAWIERKYPNLDADETMEAFIDAAPNFKKEQVKNWEARFRTCIRIAMVNKWTGICMPKQGQEIDTRWQEILTHAKAIGCPIERRQHESADSFRTRVNQWEINKPRNAVIDFGAALKSLKA